MRALPTLGLVTFLHLWLNAGLFEAGPDLPAGDKRFRVGYLPVT